MIAFFISMSLKPQRLKKGDTIGIVAPASPMERRDKLSAAIRYLEHEGFKVKTGQSVNRHYGYLAGTDEERAEDINQMFCDGEVRAIFCLRGGYGSPRLLNLIDYKAISENPKIFAGYSDITALSAAIFSKTGLLTFSSPMVVSDMADPDPYSMTILWDMLMNPVESRIVKNFPKHRRKLLRHGAAEGLLMGGNLTLLTGLVGTSYLPDLSGSMLFFEEIAEEPYRIDRMLAQLEHAGVLSNAAGLIFGRFNNCQPESSPSLSLSQVLAHYANKLVPGVPVMQGLSYGHIPNKYTLPFGAKATLQTNNGIQLEMMERVVE